MNLLLVNPVQLFQIWWHYNTVLWKEEEKFNIQSLSGTIYICQKRLNAELNKSSTVIAISVAAVQFVHSGAHAFYQLQKAKYILEGANTHLLKTHPFESL